MIIFILLYSTACKVVAFFVLFLAFDSKLSDSILKSVKMIKLFGQELDELRPLFLHNLSFQILILNMLKYLSLRKNSSPFLQTNSFIVFLIYVFIWHMKLPFLVLLGTFYYFVDDWIPFRFQFLLAI